jgi:hypothetical protein
VVNALHAAEGKNKVEYELIEKKLVNTPSAPLS